MSLLSTRTGSLGKNSIKSATADERGWTQICSLRPSRPQIGAHSVCLAYSTNVSLSPRGTSGGRVGEGGIRNSPVDAASSPRPSPPQGRRGRRKQCNAKHVPPTVRRFRNLLSSAVRKLDQSKCSFPISAVFPTWPFSYCY